MPNVRRSANPIGEGTPIGNWNPSGLRGDRNGLDGEIATLTDVVGQTTDTIGAFPTSHEARLVNNTSRLSTAETNITTLQGKFPVTTSEIASEGWVSYVPAWTATSVAPSIGNGSLRGFYMKIGRTVWYRIHAVFGSTTTFGSGNYTFSLPFATVNTGVATDVMTGTGDYFGSGSSRGFLIPHLGPNITSFAVIVANGLLNPTTPVTWVSGSQFHMSGVYEAAS